MLDKCMILAISEYVKLKAKFLSVFVVLSFALCYSYYVGGGAMAENLKEIFAKNLRKYLSLSGYTQADLTRRLNVSSATASDWCNGNKMPRSDKLQAICNWLGIDLSDLLTESSDEDDKYYLNPETARIAQQIYDDPDLRILFDAAEDVSPESIRLAAEMLRRMKETNPDG